MNRESLSITSEFKLGLYVTRQLILRQTPKFFKFIQFTEIKIYSYIFKAQKRLNKLAATEITQTGYSAKTLQINWSFFASYGTHAMIYFASVGIFMQQGRRMQRQQNHWFVKIFWISSSMIKKRKNFRSINEALSEGGRPYSEFQNWSFAISRRWPWSCQCWLLYSRLSLLLLQFQPAVMSHVAIMALFQGHICLSEFYPKSHGCSNDVQFYPLDKSLFSR